MWRATSFIGSCLAFTATCIIAGSLLWLAFNLIRGVQ